MKIKNFRQSIAAFILLPVVAQAQIEITLKRSFIEKYKDRVTIDADFVVENTDKKPNSPSKDGDMHVAGRSPEEIGLPIVAEIMNASGTSTQLKQSTQARRNGRGDSFDWCVEFLV